MQDVLDITVAGAAFRVREPEHEAWFWPAVMDGTWEPVTFATLRQFVPPGGLYLDVGAWIGPTVLYAATIAGRVVALEPDPVAAAALRENLSLNPELDRKVQIINAALVERDEPIELHTARAGNSMTSVLAHRGQDTVSAQGISAKTFLDQALGDARDCFIKIDVEGAEFAMVPLLCEELRRRDVSVTLYVALHGHLFEDTDTPGGWARNLRRHGDVLAALADVGEISIQATRWWEPLRPSENAKDAFHEFLTIGGSSASVLVRRG